MRPDKLIEARFSLTAKQNDIIDMVLSQIKDDGCFRYELDIERYKNFYRTDTSNIYRDFKKAVESFEGKGFSVINNETNERVYYPWFSKIHYKNNEGKIFVNLDVDFKNILLEVKKRIYYDITYTLNFRSVYSKRLYYYLKSFEDTGWRIDDIDELRDKMECPQSYRNFSDFKRYVLDPAYTEINNESDINFEYNTIKEGRRISKIEFTIIRVKKGNEPMRLPLNLEEEKGKELINDEEDQIEAVAKITEGKLSKSSIKTLLKVSNGDIEKIKEKYMLAKKTGNINDLGKWMYSAIKGDYKSEKSMKHRTFNNFEGRRYTPEEIEKITEGLLKKSRGLLD